MDGAFVFGVVGGTAAEPLVAYLDEPQPLDLDLRERCAPVEPAEVFRIGAPCAESGCRHFDGGACSLGARTVQLLPPVVSKLPACRIRPSCRWFREQGGAACVRCPAVVTTNHLPTAEQARAAEPDVA